MGFFGNNGVLILVGGLERGTGLRTFWGGYRELQWNDLHELQRKRDPCRNKDCLRRRYPYLRSVMNIYMSTKRGCLIIDGFGVRALQMDQMLKPSTPIKIDEDTLNFCWFANVLPRYKNVGIRSISDWTPSGLAKRNQSFDSISSLHFESVLAEERCVRRR